MEYRGYEIELSEATNFRVKVTATANLVDGSNAGASDYSVSSDDGLVFLARSNLGRSFANTADEALRGAKQQIDEALTNTQG